MKLLFLFLVVLSFAGSFGQISKRDPVNKLLISKSDSSMWLTARMRLDHQIFGYASPNINSERLILLSIFTSDVKDNPYKCPFGAYYEAAGMEEQHIELKFVNKTKWFIKAHILRNDSTKADVYFLKKWVKFEE